ncbi:hypothetical protein RDI58_002350 [Solanum bulbocastanum]
MMIFGAP